MRRQGKIVESALLLPLRLASGALDPVLAVLIVVWFGRNDGTDVYAFAWTAFALARAVAQPRGRTLAPALSLACVATVGAAAGTSLWFFYRFDGPACAAALLMVLPFALTLPVLAGRTVLRETLESRGRRVAPMVADAVAALVAVAVAAAARAVLSIYAVPTGVLAGEAAAAWVAFAAVRAPGPASLPAPPLSSSPSSGPASIAVLRVGPLVAQLAAPLGGVFGGGTLLFLADAIATALAGIWGAVAPGEAGRRADDRASTRTAIVRIVLPLVVASLGLGVTGSALLPLVFGHGAMDRAGVAHFAHLLPYVLVGVAPAGLLAWAAQERAFAEHGRRTGLVVLVVAVLDLVSCRMAGPRYGIPGIGLSVASVQTGVALFLFARAKRGV